MHVFVDESREPETEAIGPLVGVPSKEIGFCKGTSNHQSIYAE